MKHPATSPSVSTARLAIQRFLRFAIAATTRPIAVVAVLVTLACAALAPGGDGRPLVLLVDLVDVSGSVDLVNRCAEVVARVRPVLEDPRTQELDLLVLATGGASLEPDVLIPWTRYVAVGGLYESRSALARARTAWISGVEQACRERLRAQDFSPVYEAVVRALEALSARCADRAGEGRACSRRILSVHSDLRSTSGLFGTYLRALSGKRTAKAPVAPPRLAVEGVELSFCGLSNTDAGDHLPAEVVRRAWSEVLGRPLLADPTCATETAADGGSL